MALVNIALLYCSKTESRVSDGGVVVVVEVQTDFGFYHEKAQLWALMQNLKCSNFGTV